MKSAIRGLFTRVRNAPVTVQDNFFVPITCAPPALVVDGVTTYPNLATVHPYRELRFLLIIVG